ncbi:hypothetical protein RXV94_12825 [Yeosuana sp. MJ-SS3]|uniref:Secreted protein n=1 Tax=Gilvirhabdus luticola TaxID=3079858 RepID=A0ABU3U9J4_9FLAO|nr:hypothetical protein [Yeosuana sp. MJ-SS3]MDU8887046.1 hypothetical protein [Yeosuana sp. MJ-SS3]
MKYLLFFILIFFVFIDASAQLDSQNNSTVIPAEENKDANTPALDIKPLNNDGLSDLKKDDKVNGLSVPANNDLVIDKNDFSMFDEEKFANPAELFDKQLRKNLKMPNDIETKQYGSTTNQFLGDFTTKALYIKVVYRDHEYFDGDRIRVFVNDDVYQSNILLESDYKGFKLDLVEGFNKIDFQALNQGTSGPNTAEFQVVDDAGNIISSNRWNLATGVKASIMIIKE